MSTEPDPIGDAIRAGASFERVCDPKAPRNHVLVSCVRVEPGVGHDRVTVFNRGGNAGTLTVTKGDGVTIARALIPDGKIEVLR